MSSRRSACAARRADADRPGRAPGPRGPIVSGFSATPRGRGLERKHAGRARRHGSLTRRANLLGGHSLNERTTPRRASARATRDSVDHADQGLLRAPLPRSSCIRSSTLARRTNDRPLRSDGDGDRPPAVRQIGDAGAWSRVTAHADDRPRYGLVTRYAHARRSSWFVGIA